MRRSTPLLVLAVAVLLSSCALPGAARSRTATAVPSLPGRLTVVSDGDPVAAAVAASRALFRSSDVAVLAGAEDVPGLLLGASAAVGLGVPLLLEPPGGNAPAVGEELDRLGAGTVLVVGAAVRPEARSGVIRVAGTAAALLAAGVPLRGTRAVAADAVPSAIAGLRPGAAPALVPDGGPSNVSPAAATEFSEFPGRAAERVPAVTRGRTPAGELLLATGGPETVAGIATARAAGVPVVLTGGTADPRVSSAVVTTLAQSRPSAVVALGAAFAAEPGLAWQLATATTGRQLPGGGQVVLPGRTLVALYGTPGTAALGVLGEQDLPASVARAKAAAAAFQPLVAGPVVPTFEIIATVASPDPGPDGDYSTEIDPETLRPWVQAAAAAGMYVVLDLQPGRSDFVSQAERYVSLLRMPNVGLALDPEWRLAPGQLPLQQIGSVGVAEVNRVVTWLADLTRQRLLPQKLLIVHQFRSGMVEDRDRLDTSRQELAVVVHADGQGSQGSKQATWRTLHQDVPAGPLFWGWKNFYDEDHPMLTPAQTVGQVHPTPDLISYQ